MGQDTQLSEPRTPPSAPARGGGREPQTQSRTPRPALRQVPAPRTAWPRRGSAGGLQTGERVEARTSMAASRRRGWPPGPRRDRPHAACPSQSPRGGRGRGEPSAPLGFGRSAPWQFTQASRSCPSLGSRPSGPLLARPVEGPPVQGPPRSPSSWVSPLPCRPLAAPSPGRPLPLPSLATARHRGAARALLPAGIAPRSSTVSALTCPRASGRPGPACHCRAPSPRGSGGSLGAAADVASAPTLHSGAQAGRRAATRHVQGKCRNAQRGGARKER